MSDKNKYSKFNKLLFPVTLLDNKGKIIYKNSVASKYKCFRIGVSADRVFTQNSLKDFNKLLEDGTSCVLLCNSKSYLTYAVAFRYDKDAFAVFYIMNSTIYRSIMNVYKDASALHIKSINDSVIKMYREMCDNIDDNTLQKTDRILKINSLKFERANRHFSIIINSLTKLITDYSLVNINKITTEIIAYIDETVASQGYKANTRYSSGDLLTRLDKETFICTFLTLVTLSMKLSKDGTVNIAIFERDYNICFSLRFDCANLEEGKILYKDEFYFLQRVATVNDWMFLDAEYIHDKLAEIVLVIPIRHSVHQVFLKAPTPDTPDAMIAEIINEELSILL